MAEDFRPKSPIDDVGGAVRGDAPLELVKFLLTNAAASSRKGDVRKVMLIDIGKAHLYAPIEEEQYVELPPERASLVKCETSLHSPWVADRSQQLGERVRRKWGL